MHFLRQLFLAGILLSPLLAVGNGSLGNTEPGADSAVVESSIAADLNHSYTIANPYANSENQPFTIGARTAAPNAPAAPAASKVTCGGRTWTHDELLGHTRDGQPVRVRLQDDRVYLNWNGIVSGNIWILFSLQEGTFPDNPTIGSMIDRCVNPVDPSTAPNTLLGRNGNGDITCKGIVIPHNDLLGTYVANWGETRQFAKVVNGMLRIAIKQGPNDTREDNYNMSLMNFTIRGADGSYMAPKWKNVLTEEMVNGCFWPIVPKPATPVIETNCASGPTVRSVTGISQTGLTFNFDGSGVNSVKWRIRSGGTTVRSGTTGTLSSNNSSISFNSLDGGTYSLEIEGANCLSGTSSQNFTITVVPGNCTSGPTVRSVSNISQTGLTFNFDALNVNRIKWKIKSNGSEVRSGDTGQLTSANVNVTYNSLSPGNYTFEIEGSSCISSPSQINFTIPGSMPNCTSGPTISSVSSVSQTGLTFNFNGSGVSTVKWRIKSGGSEVRSGTTGNLSSNNASITFNSLNAGSYTLEIEGDNCKSSVSSSSFTIVVGPQNCPAGPTVQSVSNITQTGLTFSFDAVGVSVIKWRIKSGSSEVRSGTTGTLTSSVVNVSYNSLNPGTYTFEIEGSSCNSSVSSRSFTIAEPNCASGPTLSSVSGISQTGLTFNFSGSGVTNVEWRIKSGGTEIRSGTTGNLTSNSASITFNSLDAGNYSLEIEGGNCKSSVSSRSFTVVVGPQNCPAGPTVQSVSNITQTGLTFGFDAVGVSVIKWRIKSGSSEVRSGTTGTLTSAIVNVTYNSLSPGTYTFEIEGSSCNSSVSSRSFTITEPNCASGPTLSSVSNISQTGLTFNFSGSGVTNVEWRIKSGSTEVRSGTTGNLTSNSASITFNSLNAGSYSLEIEGGNCKSSVSSRTFTVVVTPQNCPAGPTVQSVSNITQTGLTFGFDAVGVSVIKWRIKSGGSEVRSGTTGTLTSALVNITYTSLNPGAYVLEIEGSSCNSSVSTRSFTIAEPNCASGPILTSVTNITQTGLTINFSGSGVTTLKWLIRSNGTVLRSGTTGNLTSNSANIAFNSLNAGGYALEIEGGNCQSAPSSRGFTVVVSTPTCPAGPTVQAISNITQTGLTFRFDAVGVSVIKWRIKSNGSEVRSGTTGTLSSSTVNVAFNALSPGNYSFEIEGSSCSSSVSARSFTVPEPVVGLPDCVGGPAISTIKNVTASSLTVDFAGANVQTISWRVLKGSSTLGSGTTGSLTSKSADIVFPFLSKDTYTLEIKPENCKGPAVTSNFSVTTNDSRTNCDRGPTLTGFVKTSESSLEFRFDGNNVFAIDWKIMQGSNAVRQNRVAPQNNHPVVQYASLSNGEYTFQVQGGNCKSTPSVANFSVGTALPIYISSFKGDVVDEGVELKWEVVAEDGGKEFEVLRYDDKMEQETVLGKVSLTDQRVGWYQYLDNSPRHGMSYYRLKQIDIDGTYTKSKIVAINATALRGTLVAPNPAQDYVDVQFSSRTSGKSYIVIYNAAGMAISSLPIQIHEGKNTHRVITERMKSGDYFMKISHGGDISNLRFTKMN